MAPSVIDFDGSQTLESFDVDFLRKCTAVFFAGGDQNRITDLMEKVPGLRELFIAAYNQGLPMAGTSAGAAIMSRTMITGDGDFDVIDHTKVGVSEKLGLVVNAVIDQHFIVRKRLNRLISVLSDPDRKEPYGLGVDEDVAIALTDGKDAEVLCEEGRKAILLERIQTDTLESAILVRVFGAGAKFELIRSRSE